MGTNETNLHRAARRLQRTAGISYQQARQRILAARAAGRPTDPNVIAAELNRGADQSARHQNLRATHDAEAPLDDGERRCAECGDSFNLAEGGTDFSAQTLGDDGLCIRCEAAVVDDERIVATRAVAVGDRYEDLSPAKCAGAGTVIETNVDGNPNLVLLELDGGGTLRVDIRRFETGHLDDRTRGHVHQHGVGYQQARQRILAARDARDERNGRTDLCETCKPLEHPTCSDDPGCVCCARTRAQLAENS